MSDPRDEHVNASIELLEQDAEAIRERDQRIAELEARGANDAGALEEWASEASRLSAELHRAQRENRELTAQVAEDTERISAMADDIVQLEAQAAVLRGALEAHESYWVDIARDGVVIERAEAYRAKIKHALATTPTEALDKLRAEVREELAQSAERAGGLTAQTIAAVIRGLK